MNKIILLLSKGETIPASFSNLNRIKCSGGRVASVSRINKSSGTLLLLTPVQSY